MIKCKFCEWSHKRYYKTKKGTYAYTYLRLLEHVEDQHPEEFERITEILDKEMKRKLNGGHDEM